MSKAKKAARLTNDDIERLDDLLQYLGGLRDLLTTDLCDDDMTINRQHLYALIEPAFKKCEGIYCDFSERQCATERENEEAGAE